MSKSLVLYYSQSKNTEKIAQCIHRSIDSDLLKIEPLYPYSNEYSTFLKEVHTQFENKEQVPYQHVSIDLDAYETIFIGSPNWDGHIALPLATFLQDHSFQGKKVLPFLSHKGGGKEEMETDLLRYCAKAEITPSYAIYEDIDTDHVEDLLEWIHTYL